MCDNCEIFRLIDDNRLQWYNQLGQKNIELHKKVRDQRHTIIILKEQLLEKRTSFLTEYLSEFADEKEQITKHIPDSDEWIEVRNELEKKCREINSFIRIFHHEKESYQTLMKENERFCMENLSYMTGLVDSFRETLFNELSNSNKLKNHFTKTLNGIASSNQNVLFNNLKDEGERLHIELQKRYKNTITKMKEDNERQNELILKLRDHNRKLYALLRKHQQEYKQKTDSYDKELGSLKCEIKRLREKNDYLHTQIKLEVEGCQNDIFDARKKLRLLKTNTIVAL